MTSISRASAVQSGGAELTYTNSFADSTIANVTAQVIFTPAQNVNGAYIEYIGFSGLASYSGGGAVTILAKSSAPNSANDGDAVFKASTGTGGNATAPLVCVAIQQFQRIKIPAGKGLYLNQTMVGGAQPSDCQKTVLFTLL